MNSIHKIDISIHLLLLSILLIPVDGNIYLLTAMNQLSSGIASLPSLFKLHPFLAIILVLLYWSMLLFIVWIGWISRTYWSKSLNGDIQTAKGIRRKD